ncbi:unnamed protein product, partial [Rotaria sp. Silwood2]
ALMDNQELRTDQVTRWTVQSKMIVFLCEQSYVQERQDKYWKCAELDNPFDTANNGQFDSC